MVSTSPAGTFITDKTAVGQAGRVTVSTAEGLVKARWHNIVVPPADVFKGEGNILGAEIASIAARVDR